MNWSRDYAKAILAALDTGATGNLAAALTLFIASTQVTEHLDIVQLAWANLPVDRQVELRLIVAQAAQVRRLAEAAEATPTLDRLYEEHDAAERKKEGR